MAATYRAVVGPDVIAEGHSFEAVRLAALEAARERGTPVTIRSDDDTITIQPDEATDEAIAEAREEARRVATDLAHRISTLASTGRTW